MNEENADLKEKVETLQMKLADYKAKLREYRARNAMLTAELETAWSKFGSFREAFVEK